MREKIYTKDDFITTKWAGGETTQFLIYPEGAVFSERDFLFRISSATFTSTESEFSNFSGYQRYILPLEGSIKLIHKGLYTRELGKFEPEYFDGSWTTLSENTPDCRDYNYIVRNGSNAMLQMLQKGDKIILNASNLMTLFSIDSFTVSHDNGRIEVEEFSLLTLETDEQITIDIIEASSPIILTEFKTA
ncbi:MAG: HutD family protein [Gudongella sp.]|jgi:environmental stress-induced protein Ves|nr:HutD family protein [Gudongella sp.]